MRFIRIKRVISGIILVFGFICATLWISGIRAVGIYSPDLQTIPFGFNFRGQPLTGFVYETYQRNSSGLWRLARITFLYKGLRHGPDIYWYDNGQRWIERHYKKGLESGIHRAWYPDGSAKYLKSFSENGKPHGDFYTWHGNGVLSEFVRFHQGQEIAAKSWTGGGKPFYNYVINNGKRIGLQGDTYCEPRKYSN